MFQQLINVSRFPCRTLYIVGPAYLFDIDDKGQVLNEDAVSLDESWERLAALNWKSPHLPTVEQTIEALASALERMRARIA